MKAPVALGPATIALGRGGRPSGRKTIDINCCMTCNHVYNINEHDTLSSSRLKRFR